MEDLTVGQIIETHERIMADAGGDCRLLSEANLHQLIFRANLLPECVPRAVLVFYSLCAYPAFRQGNSEIAMAVTEQVLTSGGYQVGEGWAGILAFGEGILASTTEPEEIEEWLRDHIRECPSR